MSIENSQPLNTTRYLALCLSLVALLLPSCVELEPGVLAEDMGREEDSSVQEGDLESDHQTEADQGSDLELDEVSLDPELVDEPSTDLASDPLPEELVGDLPHDLTSDLEADLFDAEPDGLDASEPDGPDGPVLYPAEQVHSPITRNLAARLREVARSNLDLQNDVFMKVGASGTVSTHFMHCFDGGPVDLSGRDGLWEVIDHFLAGSGDDLGSVGDLSPFNRNTYAAEIGRTAAWAISGSPSPLDNEVSAIRPRFAVINYGTNDMNMGTTHASAMWGFYENYFNLVEQVLEEGIIPILTNLLPRGDSAAANLWVPTYNAVIRGIAQALQVPHLDYHLAVQSLDGFGLSGDGLHANVYSDGGLARPCIFNSAGLSRGYNTRNLITIQALDRVVDAVLWDGSAPDVLALEQEGDGSPENPFAIASLPYAHLADTLDSPHSRLDVYTGCGATQDESGPEWLYRWTATRRTPIRALVAVRGSVDIDVHLLDHTGTEAGCIARAHRLIEGTVEPGEYIFSLDTWVNASGVELAGEYLFVLLECTPGDASCATLLNP